MYLVAVQDSSADLRPGDRTDRAVTYSLMREPIVYADTSTGRE